MSSDSSSSAPDLSRQIVGVATFVGVIYLNGLAGSGALSGESIGRIANRYASAFLPANYVFGIWSLIYLGLLGFSVYQALPWERANPILRRVGWWWPVNGALNVAWIVAFSFGRFGLAMLLMVGLLANLIVIHARIGIEDDLRRLDRIFVALPFSIYLAWISVALISNTFQYVTYAQWGGWGIDGSVWSAVMMVVATGLGAAMAWWRRIWAFPIVVAWALAGIGVRFPETPILYGTAWTMVAAGVVLLVVSRFRRPGVVHLDSEAR